MEHGGNQSLSNYMKAFPNRRLDEEEARRLFKQIAEGIHYCHCNNIIHRDIKLENMLLDEHNNIKIIDFGFSICMPNTQRLKIFCGTPTYMSPEIVSKIEYIGQCADIWSLGILLYVMLCGKFPFKGLNDQDLYKKIKRGAFEIPTYLSADCQSLIQDILKVRPEHRPTTQDILLHKWLRGA